jgi:hypothetical protein
MHLKYALILILFCLFSKENYSGTLVIQQPQDIYVCPGSQAFLNISAIDSVNYQWQYFDNAWVDLVDNMVISGSQSDSLMIMNVDPNWNAVQFRCVVSDAQDFDTSQTVHLFVIPETVGGYVLGNGSIELGASTGAMVLTGHVGDVIKWQKRQTGDPWLDITHNSATLDDVPAMTGTWYYRAIVQNEPCSEVPSDSAEIMVFPGLTITDQPDDTDICSGEPATFSISSSGGGGNKIHQWQARDASGSWNNVINNTPLGAIYTNQGTQTLNVSGINSPGVYYFRCTVYSTINPSNIVFSDSCALTVFGHISIDSISPDTTLMCIGGNRTFSISVTGGTNLNYQWYYRNGSQWTMVNQGVPFGAVYSGLNTQSLNISGISQAGYYHYRCQVSSSMTGCQPDLSSVVVLRVLPDPSVMTPPVGAAICSGGSASMSVTISGGFALEYQWQHNGPAGWASVADGIPTGAFYTGYNTPSLTVAGITAAGSFNYRCIVTSTGSGCGSVTSPGAAIVVHPDPSISGQSPDGQICSGGGHSFSVNTSGGISLNFQWEFLNGSVWTTASSGVPAGANYSGIHSNTLSVNGIHNPDTFRYRCIVSSTGSGCGIGISTPLLLVIHPDPSIILQPAGAVLCSGDSLVLNTNASGGIGLQYQWEYLNNGWMPVTNGMPAGAAYVGSQTSQLKVNGISLAGIHKYRCKVFSPGSDCDTVKTDTVSVTVKPSPAIINPSLSQEICSGNNTLGINLISNHPGTTISWCVMYASNGVSGFSPCGGSVIPAQTLINTNHLPGTVRYLINLSKDGCSGADTSYTITVNPLPVVSAGQAIGICAGSSVQLHASGGVLYAWSPSAGLNDPLIPDPDATPSISTLYTVTATNVYGCSGQDHVLVPVSPLPLISASASDTVVCFGDTVSLTASGGLSYIWSPNVTLNSNSIINPKAFPDSSITYYVTASDANNCIGSDSIRIHVLTLPVVLITSSNDQVCAGDSVTLYASGGVQYYWNTGETNDTIMVSPSVTQFYYLTAKDTSGCRAEDAIIITVLPLPLADAGPDTSICAGSMFALQASGGVHFKWHPSRSLSDYNVQNPLAYPKSSTTYKLSVTDAFGCKGEDSVRIDVIKHPAPLIEGDTLVCSNAGQVLYSVNTSGNSIFWAVNNGQIISGQYTPEILVDWNAAGAAGKVTVLEHLFQAPFCATSDSLLVIQLPVSAPDPPVILAKSGNINTGILVCPQCAFNYYHWGYELKSNPVEIPVSAGNNWCNFGLIDTTLYRFWLKVANDTACTTKAWFNPPPAIISVEERQISSKLCLFPNPANGLFTVALDYSMPTDIQLRIKNMMGQVVNDLWINHHGGSYFVILNLEQEPNGIYQIEALTPGGILTGKILIIK